MIYCCPECPNGQSTMCIHCPIRTVNIKEEIPVYDPEELEYQGDNEEFLDSLE